MVHASPDTTLSAKASTSPPVAEQLHKKKEEEECHTRTLLIKLFGLPDQSVRSGSAWLRTTSSDASSLDGRAGLRAVFNFLLFSFSLLPLHLLRCMGVMAAPPGVLS